MLGDGWVNVGNPWAGAEEVLSFLSLGDGIILAGSSRLTGTGKAHWYRSINWGDSWVDKGEMPTAANEDVRDFIDVGGVRVIACLGPGEPEIHRSEDKGDSFIFLKNPLGPFQDGAQRGVYCGGDIVLVATRTAWIQTPKCYRSIDEGLTWNAGIFVSTQIGDGVTSMIYSGSGVVLLGTVGGEIARSPDSGASWNLAIKTFAAPSRDVMDFVRIDGVVYCGLKKGEIWKSVDNGLNWTLFKDIGVQILAMTYGAGYWFVATADGHVHRSIDSGQNFVDVGYVPPDPGLVVRRLYFCQSETDYIVLAGTGWAAGDGYIMKATEAIAPVAEFSGTPTSGYVPLTVQFTDLSTNNPTSWLWDFGDEETSIEQNPIHIYDEVGIYTVTLTATNAGGSDDEVKTDYITVLPGANFSAQPLAGKYPLTVHFTDLCLYGPISWLWDFGDREISKEQNPTHIYKEAGLYTVSLTATNEAGSDTETKFGYIEAIERSFIEKRGIEERQLMKIRHISLKRGLAMAERIPIRIIDVRRDPAPKRIWK